METEGLTLNRKETPATLRGAREKASQVPYYTTQSNFSSSVHSAAFQLLSHSEPSIKPLQCVSWLNTGFRWRSYLSPSPTKWKGCPLRIQGYLPSYQVPNEKMQISPAKTGSHPLGQQTFSHVEIETPNHRDFSQRPSVVKKKKKVW